MLYIGRRKISTAEVLASKPALPGETAAVGGRKQGVSFIFRVRVYQKALFKKGIA